MGDRHAIGLLFPGQASQFPGMGKELYDSFPAARAVFAEASEALGEDLAERCFRGSEEDLRLTENTQPCIFTVSVAAFRVLEEETGVSPCCAAGHSLGEYSALVAAGALPLADGVRILRHRGKYMQEAVPVGRGAMAAVMGLSLDRVEDLCRESSAQGVVAPANLNGGDQIVISGSSESVAAACEAARAAGAKRAVMLPVSAPFHCSLMQPAADRLSPELASAPWSPLRFPVIANVNAEPYPSEREAAGILVRQIVSPVRWEECVRRMRTMGAAVFLEVGPGKVLSGLLRRIDREANGIPFGSPQDLESVRPLTC